MKVKSWKTGIAGVLLALAMQGEAFGLEKQTADAAQGIAVILLGLSAKDYDATGGKREEKEN